MPPTMRINSGSNFTVGRIAVGVLAVSAVLGSGCSIAVNPFHDEMQPPQRVTTASVDGAQGHDGAASTLTRSGPEIAVAAHSGTVRHLPVYYEDPVIEQGSDDGRMAWTLEDYWQYLAWQPARFLAETVTWPLQAAMHLPWQVHASDGAFHHICWDGAHDAQQDRG